MGGAARRATTANQSLACWRSVQSELLRSTTPKLLQASRRSIEFSRNERTRGNSQPLLRRLQIPRLQQLINRTVCAPSTGIILLKRFGWGHFWNQNQDARTGRQTATGTGRIARRRRQPKPDRQRPERHAINPSPILNSESCKRCAAVACPPIRGSRSTAILICRTYRRLRRIESRNQSRRKNAISRRNASKKMND